ncbi:MAG: hypothetical protein E6Q44_11920 [Flavobacteriales bacterium]|nr:MAG: hypothetical protein E6Q44_11920 [Flavobacteriales bacterium]
MKRIGYIAVCLVMTGCGDPAERTAERALYQGAPPYREQRYDEAAAIYATATHDPRAAYNLGNALHRQHLLDSALAAYRRAVELTHGDTSDANGHFNLGNTWASIAMHADSAVASHEEALSNMRIEGNDIALKLRQVVMRDSVQKEIQRLDHLVDSALAQSAVAYKACLRRTPNDEEARYDLASVQQRIAARVKEAAQKAKDNEKNKNEVLSEKAKQLMQQADELVDAYRFAEALAVLQQGLKAEPSLAKEQEYMNKLDVVTKAAQAK